MSIKEEILENWENRVAKLNILDVLLEKNKSKLTKKHYKMFKDKLNDAWINIWDYYPDKNPEISRVFHELFDDKKGEKLCQ